MEDYKIEIEQTRVGCLGSSDARLVSYISGLGKVPKTAIERLAILKGFCEGKNVTTPAMRFGDFIEQSIFSLCKQMGKEYESNPLWESKKFSRSNVRAISHPDMVDYDYANHIIRVYEVKASKFKTAQVRDEYRHQLYWHSQFAKEKAEELGKEWKYKVYLVHYDTEGVDYDNHEFDSTRMKIKEVRFPTAIFDINRGMDIVNDFLETFDTYYSDEEINADMLPEKVYNHFLAVCDSLQKMKEIEKSIETFKEQIYAFMQAKNIKSIKNDFFVISRVDPTESVGFDYKRYLDDYMAKHPTKAKRIIRQYEKRTTRKGYASIKVKKQ